MNKYYGFGNPSAHLHKIYWSARELDRNRTVALINYNLFVNIENTVLKLELPDLRA